MSSRSERSAIRKVKAAANDEAARDRAEAQAALAECETKLHEVYRLWESLGFKDGKRPKVVSVGDSLNGAVLWKIVAINERQVEMLDTRNDIRKTISLTPKSTT